jgi:hypothetical protein
MRVRVPEEFVPLARFPTEAADWVAWVEESHRPVVITRGGRALAVLVDPDDYFGGGEGLGVLRTLAADMQREEHLVKVPVRPRVRKRPAGAAGKGARAGKARKRARR